MSFTLNFKWERIATNLRVGPAAYVTTKIAEFRKMLDLSHIHGFTALEVEFVRITASEYPEIDVMKELSNYAYERNINLSIHGSLYINLAAIEQNKMELAKEHIIQGYQAAKSISANIIFHAGYFQDLQHITDNF